MSRLDEQLTEQFHQWERRGRGWQVFDEPVFPEPPFQDVSPLNIPSNMSETDDMGGTNFGIADASSWDDDGASDGNDDWT